MKHQFQNLVLSILLVFGIAFSAFSQLEFIENKGQWPQEYGMRAKLAHGDMWLSKDKVAFVLSDFGVSKESDQKHAHSGDLRNSKEHCYTMEFLGASSKATLVGQESKPQYHNYFISKDPKQWASRASLYETALQKDIYPKIDLIWKSENDELKYEFAVKPGGNPTKIKTKYRGLDGFQIQKNGELLLRTSLGNIQEMKPIAFQMVKGKKVFVNCQFKETRKNEIGFDFPDGYNKNETLIIDPVLVFSSFSGSRSDNWGFTATPGENGTAYSGGIAFGPLFPVTTGAYQQNYMGNDTLNFSSFLSTYDIAILKYSADGKQLLYATYLGGSEAEVPSSLVVDLNNNLIVLGATSSGNFPVTASAYSRNFNGGTLISPFGQGEAELQFRQGSDILVSKLSPDGTQLLGSTFLGGSDNDGVMELPFPSDNSLVKNYGDCYRGEVLVDSLGKIYVASNTRSSNFPVLRPIQATKGAGFDGVCTILSSDLSNLEFSTFLGGNNNDGAFSLQLGKAGTLYVTGGTASTNFPTTNNGLKPSYSGSIDGFVCKFSPRIGLPSYRATYLGTNAYDQAYFVQLDKQERVYVFGQTKGNYPIVGNVYANPNSGQFIHCLSTNLDSTRFSTTFGTGDGNTNISPTAFLVDDCGRIYCSGWGGVINRLSGYSNGFTSDMPTTPDALIKNSDGSDFYIIVLEKNAVSIGFATFFGDTIRGAEHVDGGTSRFDKRGVIYQSVCAGCGGRSGFPTTPGVVSTINGSANCNNAVFKYDFSLLKARYQPSLFQACASTPIRFNSESIFASNYIWDFKDGSIVSTTKDTISHSFNQAGTYSVKLVALNRDACPNIDSLERTIVIQKPPVLLGDTLTFCSLSDTIQLPGLPNGNFLYEWTPSNFLSSSQVPNPKIIRPDSAITYSVSIRTTIGCESRASIKLSNGVLISRAKADTLKGCKPLTINFKNQSYKASESTWFWGTGDSTKSNSASLDFTFNRAGTFKVVLKAESDSACKKVDLDTIVVQVFDLPNLIDTTLLYCQTGSYVLNPGRNTGKKFEWSPSSGLNDSSLANPILLNSGIRNFQFSITDSNQCAATASIKIRDGILISKAKADTLKGCKPVDVKFLNQSFRSKMSTWFWGNGDSIQSNILSQNFVFNQSGIYKVILKVENDSACQKIDYDTLTIQVFNLPTFADTINRYCVDEIMTLKPAFNRGKQFSWSPGIDLNDSTLSNPTLEVVNRSIFQLSISDSNSCKANGKIELRDGRLKSTFSADLISPCIPAVVSLNNSSLNAQKSRWIWGNDSLEVLENEVVPIVANQPGLFKITLKVFSDTACLAVSATHRTLTIGGVPTNPIVNQIFCPGDSIVLAAVKKPGYQYGWPQFSRPFASDNSKAKIYAVDSLSFQLPVFDSLNCAGYQLFTLIPSKPKAGFEKVSLFDICFDRLNYRFTANALPATVYNWKISDSLSFSGQSFPITFARRGIYPVQLIVNQQNCRDTALVSVEINDPPLLLEPKFEFLPKLMGCNELPTLTIQNKSLGADRSFWTWNGNTTSEFEPQIPILDPQTLKLNLVVYQGLCTKSLSKEIELNPINPPNFLTQNGDGLNDVFVIKNIPKGSQLNIKNRWGNQIFNSDSYQNDWQPPSDFSTGFYLLKLPNGESCKSWIQVVR